MHDETYRMLGREREADLLREANKITRAAEVRRRRRFAGWRVLAVVLAKAPWPRFEGKPASRERATT